MKQNSLENENYKINDAIDEYFNEKEAIGTFSIKTVHNRKYELNRFLKFCNEQNIEYIREINKNIIISYLKEQNITKASKNGILYILGSFMDYLVEEEHLIDNYAKNIKKPKNYQPKTDYLTFNEIKEFYRIESENASIKFIDRNLLMFSLFIDLCLRVSEVINLKFDDVRLNEKILWIVRKRNKVEKIPLNENLVEKFQKWYKIRNDFKNSNLPWIFLSSHGKQLKPRQVHQLVSQALKRANIIKRKHGPHLLRHSGASLKAKSGENIIMLQHLLGHENLNTTRRYLHFEWDELQQMVDRSPSFESDRTNDELGLQDK